MPSLTPDSGALVLVTGANGYIALHLVRELLEKGYRVRGTVRAESKASHLRKTFESYGDKLEVVIVEDITKDGAFDEAVKDVDAVEHTASPFHTKFDDPQEAIGPAVNGTTSVIKSVLNNGASVKRIVVTSSCAAVLRVTPEPHVFSEADWNQQSIDETERDGRSAPPMVKYRASKTLAERAAWELYNTHKADVKWDLVTLNPPFVFGPVIHEVGNDATSLNTSMASLYDAVIKGTLDEKGLVTGSAWIDVRDLAIAHRLALEKSEAGGERIIVSAGSFFWQDWIDAANAVASPYKGLSKGSPGIQKGVTPHIAYDTTKATRILGLGSETPYRTIEESTQDSLADFAERGWGI